MFSIGSAGTLTSLGAAVAAGNGPFALAVDPAGKYLYAANNTSNNVSMYTIAAGTGVLVSNGVVAAGNHPEALAVDPAGRFVYVANSTGNSISIFSINMTGMLVNVGSAAAGIFPSAITSRAERALGCALRRLQHRRQRPPQAGREDHHGPGLPLGLRRRAHRQVPAGGAARRRRPPLPYR
jgi:hypothetical protein